MKQYRVAILGASGAVGQEMMKILAERKFPVGELHLLASARSAGKVVSWQGQNIALEEATDAAFSGMDIVLGAAENDIAERFAPAIVKAGAVFVDNSSAFRLDPKVPLVIPEINPEDVKWHSGIISNPKDYQSLASCPKAGFTSPLTWMCAAEVCFLRAEGALLGWNMGGTAENLYNEGIRTSFSQWGAPNADKYLSDSKSTPMKYPGLGQVGSIESPSSVTVKWAADGRELERIMVQKWIALYPNGQEAWSEIRRTGYPKVFPSQTNRSGGVLPSGATIRRVPLPQQEYDGNAEQVAKAVNEFLGGNDNCAQKLWWDAK